MSCLSCIQVVTVNVILFAGFELDCTVDGDRTLVVRCEGVSGVINDSQVVCIYDDGPMRKNLMC